jgi:ABC-type Zn uptake system ZnuABC Zn-binding protein ZnuA
LGDPDIEPWWDTYFKNIDHPGLKVLTLVEESMLQRDPLLPGNEKNPHMWMSPYNMKIFVSEINKELCAEDPIHAAIFTFNMRNYLNELNSLLDEINVASKNFNGLKLVQNHPAFFYLFKLLKIDTIIYIEEGEDKEPSAEHIASVIDAMQNENCHLIIITPQRPSSSVYEIARSTNSKIGLLSDLLDVEVDWNGKMILINSYVQLIEYNLWAIKNPTDPPPAIESMGTFIAIGIADMAVIAILIIIRKVK